MFASYSHIEKDETVLRLAGNRETVNIASDIVAEYLDGWYKEKESAQERSMPIYYPLIHLLSVSKLMVLLIVRFDAFFRKSVFSSEQVLKTVLFKLATIENKLCCFYPGKDPVCL